MELTLPSANKYDWTVSLDGKTFTQSGGGVAGTGGSTTTIKNRLPFTVKTLNDDYEVVFVVKGGASDNLFVMNDEEWMHCERKEGNVTLIVDEYTPAPYEPAERVGYVLVFHVQNMKVSKATWKKRSLMVKNLFINMNRLILFYSLLKREKGGNDEVPFTAVDGQSYTLLNALLIQVMV